MFIALVHEGLTVLQSPDVLAYAGETVTFGCSFKYRPGSMVNVRWTRAHGLVLESHHPFYKGRLSGSFRDLLEKGEVTLTLSELEKRDSDLYQCHVSNHQGESGTGVGTELLVIERNQSDTDDRKESKRDTSTELTIYRATIALAGVSIILLVTTLLLRRRKDTQRQQSAKGDSRAGGNTSEDLHYAEITFKAPAHTEYASIRTQQL
ncbi:hypothetical protein UY3_03145 [Chelonia mydas]|uniref:Ig-like domain-containing protein n=1 Tax=Chelonia mydas TaxID=8469 RepID=M7CFG2_CHEMY|nr:hypothetical protein UY3_03145 [Chelonia mydas]